jgi:hypothetical protein
MYGVQVTLKSNRFILSQMTAGPTGTSFIRAILFFHSYYSILAFQLFYTDSL